MNYNLAPYLKYNCSGTLQQQISSLAIIVGQNVILESSSYKALLDSLHARVKHL
ncbi:hypothetical protein HanPSC8_Chr04g0178371 [Helianthus annuus]|nr:hypothetical protein HanPSC8_Chr04g0178371 [Helianthus annuus]